MVKSKRAREAIEAEAVQNGDSPAQIETDAPAKKRKRSGDEDVEVDAGEVKKAKKDKKEKKDKKKEKKDKKKDKKDKHKKESRKEKKDKKKDLLDVPEDDAEEDQPAEEPAAEAVKASSAGGSPAKKDKKKDKKEKKDKKNAKKTAETDADTTPAQSATASTSTEAPTNGADAIDLDETSTAKADRHIVFVGNLPFTATAASITAHFASLAPVAVRCLRDRGEDAKPCRGIAFVEFGKVWHQRTCLDKFHHSMFDDGVSPPRKINVELTAGGGGKTKQRQEKIREKNKKLDDNRAKRIEREHAAKEAGQNGGQQGQQKERNIEDAIHPSRRGRVPGKW